MSAIEVRFYGAGIRDFQAASQASGHPISPVTFGAIVASAEHLAVLGRTIATLAPRGNVVGVHFVKLIYLALTRAVPCCA